MLKEKEIHKLEIEEIEGQNILILNEEKLPKSKW